MFEKNEKQLAFWFSLLIALWVVTPVLLAADDEEATSHAPKVRMRMEEAEQAVQAVLNAAPSKKGADTCMKCHDEDNEYPIMPLFKTRHAVATDPRTPFANEQCESCHGPGGDHQVDTKED